MANQNPLHTILNKPLSRKEFLQHIGVMLLAVFGVGRVMTQLLKQDQPEVKATGTRWGGGKFGV